MSRKNWEDDEEFMRHVVVRRADGAPVPLDLQATAQPAPEQVPADLKVIGVATGELYTPPTPTQP